MAPPQRGLPTRRPQHRVNPPDRYDDTLLATAAPTPYFVAAHFHYVLYGTFASFAGIYFWFPKITGRMLDEPLGKFRFWATFIGFHLTFLVQH
jgi:heme/copper-type cytochrome/quinol oxidase subunit 1